MFKKVVVGISGGVDSAVAALLLKSKGFNVTAVFMKNWDIVNEKGECQAEKDLEDASWVCNRLNIPLIDVNFVKDYWNEVFSNLLENYAIGKTPNPDIQCNKKIKFNKFFYYALNELGADAIATGHYARSSFGACLENYQADKNVALLKAIDLRKDQTFFLSQTSQAALRRTMFPVGEYLKSDIKRIAREANLDVVANKKESMGICFIGSRNFKEFIVEYVEDKPGNFIDLVTGQRMGKHNGIHQWTLGQGCRIGGTLVPYYVYRKDLENNNIYVVGGSHHPALYTEFFPALKAHWINEEPIELSKSTGVLDCEFRFQHGKPLVPCTVFKTSKNNLLIRVYKPQRAITPGQYAVFYSKEECLGSAEISQSGPSFYFLSKESNDVNTIDEAEEISQSCG